MPFDNASGGFPGVRWHGRWIAADVPEFEVDATSLGGELPPARFSRVQFRRAFEPPCRAVALRARRADAWRPSPLPWADGGPPPVPRVKQRLTRNRPRTASGRRYGRRVASLEGCACISCDQLM